MKRSGNWVHSLVHRSWLAQRAAKSGAVRDLAGNYVAGDDLFDAVDAATVLRGQGLELGFTHLSPLDFEVDTPRVLTSLLASLGDLAPGAELSVTPASLDLRGTGRHARGILKELCQRAEEVDAHVTVEVQDPTAFGDVLALYRDVREHHEDLGITIPANLKAAPSECIRLGADGARVRLCIGAYPAGRDVALVREHDKSLALVRCLRLLMDSPAYPMLATHDPNIIEIACRLAERIGRARGSFEFQMFYGVRPLEQRRLADTGWRSRTCIPFGTGWYDYLAMRIAARPRILASYARAVLDKR